MNVQHMNLNQIYLVGLEALARDLGPVGMVRFLQQFETRKGDYTRKRVEWLREGAVKAFGERIIQEQREE